MGGGMPVVGVGDTWDIMHGQARGDASDYIKQMAQQRAQQQAASKAVTYGPDGKPVASAADNGKKGAPAPPDYQQASQADAASSQQNVAAQTAANRPNISTPFATQSWTTGPDGTPQLSTGLAGGLGAGAAALGNQFGQANANPLDASLFGAVPNGDAARNQAINASWNQSTSRLNPMWDQKENSLKAQIAAQGGLDPNGEAARNARAEMGRDRNDAYTSALNAAIGSGDSAGANVFGQNMATHQQALSDALAQRNAPLQGLSQLQGLATGMPQFNQAGLANPTQSLAAAMGTGNYNLGNQQMQNEATASWIQGLSSILGAGAKAATMSDERAKQNVIRYQEEALPGVPFASWEWKGMPGHREMGVIAQDLQKVAPQYVSEGEDGLLRVDYSFLEGRL